VEAGLPLELARFTENQENRVGKGGTVGPEQEAQEEGTRREAAMSWNFA